MFLYQPCQFVKSDQCELTLATYFIYRLHDTKMVIGIVYSGVVNKYF